MVAFFASDALCAVVAAVFWEVDFTAFSASRDPAVACFLAAFFAPADLREVLAAVFSAVLFVPEVLREDVVAVFLAAFLPAFFRRFLGRGGLP